MLLLLLLPFLKLDRPKAEDLITLLLLRARSGALASCADEMARVERMMARTDLIILDKVLMLKGLWGRCLVVLLLYFLLGEDGNYETLSRLVVLSRL